MNIVLLVLDSLRAKSLDDSIEDRPSTPFMDRLRERAIFFRRAYATECWTLPSHASMFTGLLPSEHGAHFQSMAYRNSNPTVAQILREQGMHTEVISRNPIFDGSVPGITRGFGFNSRIYADVSPWDPAALLLVFTKPRLRQQIRDTGFFSPQQQVDTLQFLHQFATSMFPADAQALECVLSRMQECRHRGKNYFVFSNLFDVHAPYCPSNTTFFEPIREWKGFTNAVTELSALAKLSRHEYLKEGFRISGRAQAQLLHRYHTAIQLIDRKLEQFYNTALDQGLLDDTMLIICGDHGEAFGEHDLYFHDASVYDTNLHVPLWVHHPRHSSAEVDDVVSLRSLFDLINHVGTDRGTNDTILSSSYRERHQVALAEHFYYPKVPNIKPCYRRNQAAAITRMEKVILQGSNDTLLFDLAADRFEECPQETTVPDFAANATRATPYDQIKQSVEHLERFRLHFVRR